MNTCFELKNNIYKSHKYRLGLYFTAKITKPVNNKSTYSFFKGYGIITPKTFEGKLCFILLSILLVFSFNLVLVTTEEPFKRFANLMLNKIKKIYKKITCKDCRKKRRLRKIHPVTDVEAQSNTGQARRRHTSDANRHRMFSELVWMCFKWPVYMFSSLGFTCIFALLYWLWEPWEYR